MTQIDSCVAFAQNANGFVAPRKLSNASNEGMACILIAVRAKRAGLSDDDLRTRLKTVVALNMAALLVSALGLIAVVVGIILS